MRCTGSKESSFSERESGSSSRREKSVPTMIVCQWRLSRTRTRPVDTFMSRSLYKDKRNQPARPSAARPPYWRGVSAARVSRASSSEHRFLGSTITQNRVSKYTILSCLRAYVTCTHDRLQLKPQLRLMCPIALFVPSLLEEGAAQRNVSKLLTRECSADL